MTNFDAASAPHRILVIRLGALGDLLLCAPAFQAIRAAHPRAEIALLVKDGVTADELQRVKAQVMAGEVYKLDSTFYRAMQIGQMESIGLGYHAIPLMLEKIQAVTASQVQQAARDILQDDTLTIAVLEPQPLSDKPKRAEGNFHAH